MLQPNSECLRHGFPDHSHTMTVKLFDHPLHFRNAARQIAEKIVLVPAIDAEVRISGPRQNAIDAAVALI